MTDSNVNNLDSSFRSWVFENKYGLLLAALLINLMSYPFLYQTKWGSCLYSIFFVFTLMASVYAVVETRKHFHYSIAFGIPAVLVILSTNLELSQEIHLSGFTIVIAFMVMNTALIFRHVLTTGKIDRDRILGAVCVYLLVGQIFGLIYGALEKFSPDSFLRLGGKFGEIEHWGQFTYFSYTTLTTLGYGDITPASSFAQSLTSLEAIIGVMYVAVLISRLVGKFSMEAND